jgi:hypothetical protein
MKMNPVETNVQDGIAVADSNKQPEPKFCFSVNGNDFRGEFIRIVNAIGEALQYVADGDYFWIGEIRKPIQPEQFFTALEWLETVSCQDDYSGDFAEDWDDSTKTQRTDLENRVRSVMSQWLDENNLRPSHFCVDNETRYKRVNGAAELWP